jgi:hypothetical protein
METFITGTAWVIAEHQPKYGVAKENEMVRSSRPK